MKTILVLIAVLVAIGPLAGYAAETGPGCGLGKMLWKGKKGLFPHSTAWSTNATFSQPSAISSGTSNCHADQVILKEKEAGVFVAANYDNLSQDVASGHGEYIHSMATIMGCSTSAISVFSVMSQRNFNLLFIKNEDNISGIVSIFQRQISANVVLTSECVGPSYFISNSV